jgi:transposase InsO family protein
MLWKNRQVLADSKDQVGLITGYQPTIDLDTDKPIYVPQYPIPFKMRQMMKDTIDAFLKDGIITPSKSPYNAPSIIVPKKDIGVRMCIDYRVLNDHILTDRHPLPRIDQILEGLGGAMYLTALDLLHGFYNLEINPSDRWKTAFSTPDGHYEFIRLPMGLKNSPAIFQRTMNMVLQEVLGKFCFVYLDDLVVYSKSAEDHIKHLDMVFAKLADHGLRIKFTKSQLFRSQIHYLGFIVSRDGLRVNPEKVRAATEFPRPTNVKAIQAFIGLVGYFRTFIKDFAHTAQPLYRLLKNDTPFLWGEECEHAFNSLKQALAEAPVLAFPDFTKEFIITTDASADAIGAVMTQVGDDGKEHLLSCHSRTLRGAERNYDNYDREALAVFYGAEQNHSYIWGSKVRFRTDNTAVVHLGKDKRSHSARALRWFIKLGEYDYTIEHKSGRKIAHADALSRYPVQDKASSKETATVSAVLDTSSSTGGQDVVNHDSHFANTVANDENLATMLPADECMPDEICVVAYLSPSLKAQDLVPIIPEQKWKKETERVPSERTPQGKNVTRKDGIIFVRQDDENKIWVPPSLRQEVIRLYHDPPNAGHRGANATAQHLKRDVIWTSLDSDVKHYVKHCVDCQKAKNYGRTAPPYKVTPIPKRCFEEVSLDVVGPLPVSASGMKYVLVIQDRLSRWIVFAPMTNTSAETTSRTFLKEWVMVYGPPKKLLTDRGTNFVSTNFEQMATFLGTEPTHTVAYRPQANGQNERSHRELSNYLKLYLDDTKRYHWDTMLKLASWVHNSSYHRALKMSPYEVVTGMKPNQARMWLPGESEKISEDEIHQYFGVRKDKLDRIRKQAIEAIQSMQQDFINIQSKRLRPHVFKEGQQVLVKRHMQGSTARWTQSYYGPFLVTKVISESVLELEDPVTGKRDTIHVQYVKPYYDLGEFDRGIARTEQQFPRDLDDSEKEIIQYPSYYPDDPDKQVTIEHEVQKLVPDPVSEPSEKTPEPPAKLAAPQAKPAVIEEKAEDEPKSLTQRLRQTAQRVQRAAKQMLSADPKPVLKPAPSKPVTSPPVIIPRKVEVKTPPQPKVKFSSEVETIEKSAPPVPKTPVRSRVQPPAALPSTARRRRNADQQVMEDQWLNEQPFPPWTTDRDPNEPRVTRSAKKKKKKEAFTRLGSKTPSVKVRPPSRIPGLQGAKTAPVSETIRQATQTAPKKNTPSGGNPPAEKPVKGKKGDKKVLPVLSKKQSFN